MCQHVSRYWGYRVRKRDWGSTYILDQGSAGHHLFFQVKPYWSMAMIICLCIVNSCSCGPVVELSSSDRGQMAREALNIYHLDLYRNSYSSPF